MVMRITGLLVSLTLLLAAVAWGQDQPEEGSASAAHRTAPPAVATMQQPIRIYKTHTLADGTPIQLRLTSEIRSKKAQPGDVAKFVLNHDLWSGDLLVAKQGTPVEALVVEASKAKWGSRGSNLGIEIKSLEMVNGQQLTLRGTPKYSGGVGPAEQITGGLVKEAAGAGTTASNFCPLCEIVFVPAALVFLAAPGTNKTVKKDTVALAWVDGSVALDASSFYPQQPAPGAGSQVLIVRGQYGWPYGRDLYCNGVPMAHLDSGHRLALDLQPGWYRFAINPDKGWVEVYAGPGIQKKLITDYERVYVLGEPDVSAKHDSSASDDPRSQRSLNTRTFWGGQKTQEKYFQSAKPVEVKDRYVNECKPLDVELIEQ